VTGYRGNTREADARDMRDWLTWCAAAGLNPLHVTRAHCKLYARAMDGQRGLSAGTIARRLAAMSSFYAWCLDEELTARSPVARVRRPRVSKESLTEAPDRHELARLLEAAKASRTRDHALICLLGLNGLRISEAVGIDVDDLAIDRAHRLVKITGKGSKIALIPMAPRTADAVDGLLKLVEPLNRYSGQAAVPGPLGQAFVSERGLLDRKEAHRGRGDSEADQPAQVCATALCASRSRPVFRSARCSSRSGTPRSARRSATWTRCSRSIDTRPTE